jgi:phosphatidylinositol alpha-1,6-mannosyltransferase
MGIRVAVIDDNPHVGWEGRVYPANATFHRFLSGVLDVPGAPVAEIVHCVPLREATVAPETLPLDPRLEVAGTAPFDGIAGYLRNAPSITRANRPILRGAIREADLVWIKVPGSNAALAAALAKGAGIPRFAWVAGSAAAVAAGQNRSPASALRAVALGGLYDLVGRAVGFGGRRIVVGQGLVDGEGVVASLVEPSEIRDTADQAWPAIPWRLRLAWAGRLAAGKGLEVLFEAVARRARADGEDPRIELVVMGDGPLRASLTDLATSLGIGERIHWLGHVAEREPYLNSLAACDLFVSPSPAEGFPKAVLDAMAVGLPVLAAPSGELRPLAPAGIVAPLENPEAGAVAAAIEDLARDGERARALRAAGTAFVAAHTRPAEAARLVARWQTWWPDLPWQADARYEQPSKA